MGRVRRALSFGPGTWSFIGGLMVVGGTLTWVAVISDVTPTVTVSGHTWEYTANSVMWTFTYGLTDDAIGEPVAGVSATATVDGQTLADGSTDGDGVVVFSTVSKPGRAPNIEVAFTSMTVPSLSAPSSTEPGAADKVDFQLVSTTGGKRTIDAEVTLASSAPGDGVAIVTTLFPMGRVELRSTSRAAPPIPDSGWTGGRKAAAGLAVGGVVAGAGIVTIARRHRRSSRWVDDELLDQLDHSDDTWTLPKDRYGDDQRAHAARPVVTPAPLRDPRPPRTLRWTDDDQAPGAAPDVAALNTANQQRWSEAATLHGSIRDEFVAYIQDIFALLERPELKNMRNPLTAAYEQARVDADDLARRQPVFTEHTATADQEVVRRYAAAAEDLADKWHAANAHALRVGVDGQEDAGDRRRLQLAVKLVNSALSHGLEPAERDSVKEQAVRLIEATLEPDIAAPIVQMLDHAVTLAIEPPRPSVDHDFAEQLRSEPAPQTVSVRRT